MSRSNRLVALGGVLSAAIASGCGGDIPRFRAELAVSRAELGRVCERTSEACEWYGFREEGGGKDAAAWYGLRKDEGGNVAAAAVAYTRACEQSDGHRFQADACIRLFRLTEKRLAGAARDAALGVACVRGLSAACELAGAEAAARGTPEQARAALAYWRQACAEDKASCARVGLAYHTGEVGGIRVLERRDAVAAADYLQRARLDGIGSCPDDPSASERARADAYRHATPALKEQACAVRELATEDLGDLYLAGDGVRQSTRDAAWAYDFLSSQSAHAKWNRLSDDPVVGARVQADQTARLERSERDDASYAKAAEADRLERRRAREAADARDKRREEAAVEERAAERKERLRALGLHEEETGGGDAQGKSTSQKPGQGGRGAASAGGGKAAGGSPPGNDCDWAASTRCGNSCSATKVTCDSGCSRSHPGDTNNLGKSQCFQTCNRSVTSCYASCPCSSGPSRPSKMKAQ